VDYAAGNGGRGEACVWGHALVVPAASAALVNDTLAAALDFDSIHDRGTARSVEIGDSSLISARMERMER